MGTFSIWHWLIVLAIVILLFGRGKIPELMGDFAKGIKNFKKGMADDDAKPDGKQPEPKALDGSTGQTIDAAATEKNKASS
ncbi:MAG: twin-arginine translocase TatA/TatE family subunit [Hyphomicrobiaceae bacterium]|nr:twin-arginine translocase TatA/TatE family subunit [Hyphomicrobiaceae bacterium]